MADTLESLCDEVRGKGVTFIASRMIDGSEPDMPPFVVYPEGYASRGGVIAAAMAGDMVLDARSQGEADEIARALNEAAGDGL